MGIPRFKWKLEDLMKMLDYIIHVEKGLFWKLVGRVQGLYLDTNSIIHIATQYLEFDGLSLNKMKETCELIVFLIRTIANYYKPRGVLYIAVDGVVPMTKIQQQRERRYESAMTTPKGKYTGSFITPGTLFMQELHEYLNAFVDDKGSLDEHVDTVIYSSYLVPGEGEHKIMEYLRSRNLKPENGANVIYGNDADLILLALGNDTPNLYIADDTVALKMNRIDIEEYILPYNNRKAEIDIGKLRHALHEILAEQFVSKFVKAHLKLKRKGNHEEVLAALALVIGEEKSRKFTNTHIENIRQDAESLEKIKEILIELVGEVFIKDFIFLSSLMGNDFLPRSPIFADIGDDIPFIIRMIKDLEGILGRDEEMKDGVKVFEYLALRETFKIREPVSLGSLEDKFNARIITTSKGVKFQSYQSPIMQALSNVDEDDKDELFRSFWYMKCFRTNPIEPHLRNLSIMCGTYSQGMKWVYNYYIHGQSKVTWLWYYPYWYAPLFKDLHSMYKKSKLIKNFKDMTKVKPIPDENRFTIAHQLICVMPWQVSRYVPEDLLIRVYSSSSPFKHILQKVVIVDTEFAEVKHQSKVLVKYVEFYEIMYRLALVQFKPAFIKSFEGSIRRNLDTPKAKDIQRRKEKNRKAEFNKSKREVDSSKTLTVQKTNTNFVNREVKKRKEETPIQSKIPTFGSKIVSSTKVKSITSSKEASKSIREGLSNPEISKRLTTQNTSKDGTSAAAASLARQLQSLNSI